MPLVSSFYGIFNYIYFRDHNPPHIHVKYSGKEALIDIYIKEIIKGKIPLRAYKLVSEWIELHQTEILENWNLAVNGETPNRIECLE